MIFENQPTLPVRIRPFHGEATIGYLLRVSQANGYVTLSQLVNPFRSFDALCQGLNLSIEERQTLIGPLSSFRGSTELLNSQTSVDFNTSLMRWCSLCFQESAHIRGSWLLKISCVCSRHAVVLHDRCPCCGSVQRLGRVNYLQCDCGVCNGQQKPDTCLGSVSRKFPLEFDRGLIAQC
ncbi:TniQ family protein [Methylomonas sp. EFPC3]|uniref:TniQ family protein n=1 Tax=Methylomonas sp. EFPC3 TaxID=3021710 RepID=UPI002417D400|nr:TniQ family protein [Methylomonas sp. EFPC3]WFP49308.1 TniQ family protein [Methylomonas sp. EFPC3]